MPTDAEHALRADALAGGDRARSLAAGSGPRRIVATVGTTATTAVDPLSSIARDRARARHLVARRCGARRVGHDPSGMPAVCGRASKRPTRWSINPHKWLGAAFDCTDLLRARSGRSWCASCRPIPAICAPRPTAEAKNYRDWGIPLGRRFRALKLWFLIREQGVEGLQSAPAARHLPTRSGSRSRSTRRPGWKRLAPVPLQTVCVRHEPRGARGERARPPHARPGAAESTLPARAWLTPAQLEVAGWCAFRSAQKRRSVLTCRPFGI